MNGRMHMKKLIYTVIIMMAITCFASAAEEKEEPKRSFTDSAEFSLVQTGGNSEASTLGFKNLFQYKWTNALLTVKAGGIRVENTTFTRFALGTEGEYTVVEEKKTEKTAENYYLNGKYERNISAKLFWIAGAGWDRNEFAGIKSRYSAHGGVGNILIDSERRKFRFDYGLQYTKETPVLKTAGYDDSYAAFRLSYNYFQKIFTSSAFNQDFELITNLDETSDFRSSLMNSFSTSMNRHLALKVGLDLIYDNKPAFESIVLYDVDTLEQIGSVAYQLDELDYVFMTSFVITF